MKSLPAPDLSVEEVVLACAASLRNKDLARRLRQALPFLQNAELEYDELGDLAQLFEIVGTDGVDGTLTTEELASLYKGSLSRSKSRSRVFYDRIRMSAPQGICPLCQQRAVKTLDHYLPKSEHPALALTPLNLVPACSDCNKDKLHRVAAAAEEQTLHPYFDDIGDVRWLAAEVQESNPPALTFHVRQDAGLERLEMKRLLVHFDTFDLASLYATQAASEIVGIRYVLQNLHEAGGTQALQRYLTQTADGRMLANRNSWQTATYSALAASDWFCTEGFRRAG